MLPAHADVVIVGGGPVGALIALSARSAGRSVLVVQLPYSTGWSVTVDGTPAQVLRADTAFLGVALEPGSHTVAFTYKTPGLTAGAALSAAGVVLLAAIWAVPALRKKSKKRRK